VSDNNWLLSANSVRRAMKVAEYLGVIDRPEIMKELHISRGQYDNAIKTLKLLGDERAERKSPKRWARGYDHCIRCERDTQKHQGRGICGSCYHTYYASAYFRAKMDIVTWAKMVPPNEVLRKKELQRKLAEEKESRDKSNLIGKGKHVSIPCWKLDGVCLTDPYDWPRGEDIKIGKAIDIQTIASRIDGVPVEIVRIA